MLLPYTPSVLITEGGLSPGTGAGSLFTSDSLVTNTSHLIALSLSVPLPSGNKHAYPPGCGEEKKDCVALGVRQPLRGIFLSMVISKAPGTVGLVLGDW